MEFVPHISFVRILVYLCLSTTFSNHLYLSDHQAHQEYPSKMDEGPLTSLIPLGHLQQADFHMYQAEIQDESLDQIQMD